MSHRLLALLLSLALALASCLPALAEEPAEEARRFVAPDLPEGAIPYAASDPLRVIPSCIVGSAVSGAIAALFGCTCPAPHGGIFTFAVVGKPIGYLVALVAGSVVGALMLALLKKKKTN